jgi:hypothetical protein
MKPWILAGAAMAMAVSAYGVGCAQESGQPQPAPSGARAAVRQACQEDIAKLCSAEQPGGGRIMQCMRAHQDQLSDGCKSALMSAHRMHQEQQGGPPSQPQG